jgi:hypothetical protein
LVADWGADPGLAAGFDVFAVAEQRLQHRGQ